MFLDTSEKVEEKHTEENPKDDFADYPSLATLIEALGSGLYNIAIGAAKDLMTEIEKKKAEKEGGQS